MGRADDWVNRNSQRKAAYQDIQSENEQSVNVYRAPLPTEGVGFKSEAGEPVLVKTIQARIDLAKTTNFNKRPDAEQTPAKWIALTDEHEVYTGDLWRSYNLATELVYYRVVEVVPNEAGNTVYLDELRKEAWPKIAA